MSIIVLLLPIHFFCFFRLCIINYKSKTNIFSIQREIINTSLFKKLIEVSTNNFKIDINRISDWVRNVLVLHKSLCINQSEILSHSALEALHRSYLNPFPNKPWFLCVCNTSLLKTLLKTSNFSLSHSVFLPFWTIFRHYHQT